MKNVLYTSILQNQARGPKFRHVLPEVTEFEVIVELLLSFPTISLLFRGITCAPAAYFQALSLAKSFLTIS